MHCVQLSLGVRRWFLFALGWIGAGFSLQAQLLYHETFPGVAPNNSRTELNTEGWNVHGRNGAYNDAADAPRAAIRGQVGPGGTRGYAWIQYGGGGNTANDQRNRTTLLWTQEVASLNLLPSAIASVAWMQGNNNVAGQYRVAVQLGGQWFVSDPAGAQAQGSTNGTFVTNGTEISYAFAGSSWYTLAFDGSFNTSGTVLSLDPLTPTVLPNSAVQAIGLFIGGTGGGASSAVTGLRRIDDFMLFGVPQSGGGAGANAGPAAARTSQQQAHRAHQARVARDQRLQQHRRNQQRAQQR